MIRVCPHSDAKCVHGMNCAYTCATDAYDGNKNLMAEQNANRTPAPEGEAVTEEDRQHIDQLPFALAMKVYRSLSKASAPVVPVGSGESERKLVGQDYINAIKAHRVEHGSSLAVARNAVDCGWRPPAPVVPVGVSREEIARAVRPVLDRHPMIDSSQSHKLDIQAGWVADAIIAALRPTDTGREA